MITVRPGGRADQLAAAAAGWYEKLSIMILECPVYVVREKV